MENKLSFCKCSFFCEQNAAHFHVFSQLFFTGSLWKNHNNLKPPNQALLFSRLVHILNKSLHLKQQHLTMYCCSNGKFFTSPEISSGKTSRKQTPDTAKGERLKSRERVQNWQELLPAVVAVLLYVTEGLERVRSVPGCSWQQIIQLGDS